MATSTKPPTAAWRSRARWWRWWLRSSRRESKRRAFDFHGVALVTQSAEQRVDERFVAEEGAPLFVFEVGSDDCGLAAVPLLHQLEEDVRLLWAQVEVAHFIDLCGAPHKSINGESAEM